MVAGGLAGLFFWQAGASDGWVRVSLFILAGLSCQIRLLCNLFDGLVAVEGGKHAADGAFWNEFPDRVADVLILVGAGLCIGDLALGWAAASFAVLTAYTRELGRANGLQADFSGPMAKQHRMAVMTGAALLSTVEPMFDLNDVVVTIALWVVAVGAAATTLRRAVRIVSGLKAGQGETPL